MNIALEKIPRIYGHAGAPEGIATAVDKGGRRGLIACEALKVFEVIEEV